MNLFKFEIKKNWRRKKFIILFLLVLVIVVGLFFRNVWLQDKIQENAFALMVTPHIEQVNNLLREFREEVKENPENTALQGKLNNVLEMNTSFTDMRNAIQNEQWDRIPEIESDFLQTIVKHIEFGGSFRTFQEDQLEQRIEKNRILIENQLPYEDENYSLTTTNFMKIAATILISYVGVVILVFILGDQMSEEFENHTMRTLYTQPLRKWGILLSKYASMMVGTFFFLFTFIITGLVITYAFNGYFGSFTYPQLVEYNEEFTYITITKYVALRMILFIGTASFAFSLALLFSLLVKSRFSTLIVTLLVLVGGGFITSQAETLQTPLNPFYYFRIIELIERPDTLSNLINVWVLFAYSLIVLSICYITLKKDLSLIKASPNVRPYSKGMVSKTSSSLKAMLLFEWRKCGRQGYIKQIIVMKVLLVLIGYIIVLSQTSQKEQEFIHTMEENISSREEIIIPRYEERLEDELELVRKLENKESSLTQSEEEQLEIAKTSISSIQTNLENDQYELEQMKLVLAAYQEEDWASYYDYWIYQNKLWKGDIKIENRSYEPEVSMFTYNASIAEKEVLAERGLRPVLPSELMYTIYEQFPNQLEQIEWKSETQKIDSTGTFYLYTFFDLFIYIIPLGILVFLLGSGFTPEKGKKRTLHFLVTQPISKVKIFIGKTVVSITISLVIGLGLMLLIVLIGTIGNRFGDWVYPVLHYDTPDIVNSIDYAGGGFHFITMGRYLLETGLLFLANLLFLIVLSLFISLFTENIMNTFIITGILGIGGYFLVTTTAISSIAHFLPFTYLNIGKIANGEMATVLNNSSIHTWQGLGVLLVCSIVLIMIGFVFFQKSGRKKIRRREISVWSSQ